MKAVVHIVTYEEVHYAPKQLLELPLKSRGLMSKHVDAFYDCGRMLDQAEFVNMCPLCMDFEFNVTFYRMKIASLIVYLAGWQEYGPKDSPL